MRQRMISDQEIALIKSMIVRGMPNKEIQFFFNRPDRAVNSGRISDIGNGKYGKSREIEPATEGELREFIDSFTAPAIGATMSIPAPGTANTTNPLDISRLKGMFQKDSTGSWRLKGGEGERQECKESFHLRHSEKWLRAIAALTNNSGGYLLFGVKDRIVQDGKLSEESFRVVGMKNADFENMDPVDLTQKIKATFDPTPRIETHVLELDSLKVGIMYIHQHSSRPVIATRGEGGIKEGDIFYRYPGQSARIKYSDLRSILDERDRQTRADLLPMVQRLLDIGPRHAMIADLETGIIADGVRAIRIDEDLLDRIKFIREGEFKEKEGEATLRLIGEVQTVSSKNKIIERSFVTPADLIQDFLKLETPSDPKEYIRCAIEGGSGAWLPMHYYASKANLSRTQLVDFIRTTKAPLKRKQVYIERALGKKTAYKKATGGALEFLTAIRKGTILSFEDATSAANIGRAIIGLEIKPTPAVERLLDVLDSITQIFHSVGKPSFISIVRRGAARLDELYFSI